jgi:hypothetical protein
MALASDLTLAFTTGTYLYHLIKTSADGTSRIEDTTFLSEPMLLNIKHSVAGKGGAAVDRHLIQISRAVSPGVGLDPVLQVVNLTMSLPRSVGSSTTILKRMLENVAVLCAPAGSYIGPILRGES